MNINYNMDQCSHDMEKNSLCNEKRLWVFYNKDNTSILKSFVIVTRNKHIVHPSNVTVDHMFSEVA